MSPPGGILGAPGGAPLLKRPWAPGGAGGSDVKFPITLGELKGGTPL